MTEQLILPVELARELADIDINLPVTSFVPDEPEHGWTPSVHGITAVIENRHTGQEKRWTSIRELIIQTKDGRLWRRLYERGLTESQFQEPFEYEGPQIPFDECKAKTVEVFEYVPMSSPEVKVELTDKEKLAAFNTWFRADPDGFDVWVKKQIRIHGSRPPWV